MQDLRNVLTGICGCKLWAWHLNLSRCYCTVLPVLQSIFHLTRSNRPLSSDSGVQPGDQPVWADRGELGRRLHLRQPERQPSSPAGVWEQRQAVRHTRKHVYLIYHCYIRTHTFLSSVWQIKASCDLSFLNVESLMSSDKMVALLFTPAAGVNCFFLGCIAFL